MNVTTLACSSCCCPVCCPNGDGTYGPDNPVVTFSSPLPPGYGDPFGNAAPGACFCLDGVSFTMERAAPQQSGIYFSGPTWRYISPGYPLAGRQFLDQARSIYKVPDPIPNDLGFCGVYVTINESDMSPAAVIPPCVRVAKYPAAPDTNEGFTWQQSTICPVPFEFYLGCSPTTALTCPPNESDRHQYRAALYVWVPTPYFPGGSAAPKGTAVMGYVRMLALSLSANWLQYGPGITDCTPFSLDLTFNAIDMYRPIAAYQINPNNNFIIDGVVPALYFPDYDAWSAWTPGAGKINDGPWGQNVPNYPTGVYDNGAFYYTMPGIVMPRVHAGAPLCGPDHQPAVGGQKQIRILVTE